MWEWISEILFSFRECFSRKATIGWFVTIITGLLIRNDHAGVTSIIRTLSLAPIVYEAMLHFFRSTAWSVSGLQSKWVEVVKRSNLLYLWKGKPILIGDGVKQSKEGKKMPGVKRLHQESENSGKPAFIFGHMFGAIGVLVGNAQKRFCLPLRATLQDGDAVMREWTQEDYDAPSHIVRMIRDAYSVAKRLGECILLLDAYFLSVSLLQEMKTYAQLQGALITLVTRAKMSIVAYERPSAYRGRGRPRVKGAAVKLKTLFDARREEFTHATLSLYGERRDVRYYSCDLLWGSRLYLPMRFVLVAWGQSRTIFACTDLSCTPEDILELYGYRFKIEVTFRSLKQEIAGFAYHFWSKAQPRLKRFSKRGTPDPLTEVKNANERSLILSALKATEGYVQCCLIALGLLQLCSVRFSLTQTSAHLRWLRTRTNAYLSESSIAHLLRQSFFSSFLVTPHLPLLRLIAKKVEGGYTGRKSDVA